MKTISALALALSFAVGSTIAMAPAADAATAATLKKPAAVSCVATKKHHCPIKLSHKKMHNSVKKVAAKSVVKPAAGAAAAKKS